MPDWDMERQIGKYDTLGWFESYRKLSALLIAGFCFCLLILAVGIGWADLGRPLMRGTILATVVIYLVLAPGVVVADADARPGSKADP